MFCPQFPPGQPSLVFLLFYFSQNLLRHFRSPFSLSFQFPALLDFTTSRQGTMNLFATSVSLFCEVLRDLSKIRKLTVVFSRESDSLIANVRTSVSHKNPSASQNCSYRPSSLSAIKPINHWAYRPSSLSTLALLSRLLSLSACLCRKWNTSLTSFFTPSPPT